MFHGTVTYVHQFQSVGSVELERLVPMLLELLLDIALALLHRGWEVWVR